MAEKILIYGGGPVTEQIARLLAVGPHDYVVAGSIPAASEAAPAERAAKDDRKV